MFCGTRTARLSRLATTAVLLLVVALVANACGGSTKGATPAAADAKATASSSTPAAAVSNVFVSQAATPPAGSTQTNITPKEVVVGPYILRLSVGSVQHMYDADFNASASDTDNQQGNKQKQSKGLAVLGHKMAGVSANIDAAQQPPADKPGGELLRQVYVQVADKKSGQFIPYLTVTMDALRDGRPAVSSQALLPMVESGKGLVSLRYANSVRFPRSGTYQVFVRVDPNPFYEGQELPYAQFNLQLK